MKRFIVFLSAVVPFLWSHQASSQTALPEIEIIFDASGSMKEPTPEGMAKLDAAKQALTTIASEIEQGSKVGLRVFGASPISNDPEASCLDSKLAIPISAYDKNRMVSQVMALNAVGQTPLGLSLQEAAKDFNPSAAKKTIILITDGEESCGRDPVNVIQQLKAQGIDLVVHTIGFNVNPKAQGQLQQISQMTGGVFALANSAGELTKELKQIAVKAELLLKPEKKDRENILAAGNGCRIISSSTTEFAKLIDGNEEQETEAIYNGQEAVFAFKEVQPILLEGFAYPVAKQSSYHPQYLDLYGSAESPEKGFHFIGRVKIENKVYFDNVYQVTPLHPPAPLRYLKVVVSRSESGSNSYQTEWAAYGRSLSPEEFQAKLAEETRRDRNLLATENGGNLIASSNPEMKFLIDGNPVSAGQEVSPIRFGAEAIFGFQGGKVAWIKKVSTPIFATYERNPKTIEIWASTTSPTSGYEKVGNLETMNLAFAENAYQELVLEQPVRAKYLKVKFVDSHGTDYITAYELQAIGTLEP